MSTRSRPASSPWWGVGLLSVTVAASSFVVPGVLPKKDAAGDASAASSPVLPAPGPASAPPTTPLPATAVPSTAVPTPTAVSPTASPVETTRKPKPRPTFEPVTINPWARAHESEGIAVIDCPLCVSGKRVQYLGQGHYVIVRLKKVRVAGRRTMTIIYTCACDDPPRELDVMVNSDPVRTLALKGARSWDSPARTKLRVNLVKGENVIRFFNQDEPAPDLDQILIR